MSGRGWGGGGGGEEAGCDRAFRNQGAEALVRILMLRGPAPRFCAM